VDIVDKLPKALCRNGFGAVFYQQRPWMNGAKPGYFSTGV